MESNSISCPCKRMKCERHGNCEACKEHHKTKSKHLVACERIKAKEEKSKRKKESKEEKVRRK